MDVGRHLASPVRLLALFVLLAGIPLAALGWLSWRLLEQEHALDAQRLRERLENAAALIATELDRRITAWDTLLAGAARRDPVSLPANSVLILLDSEGVHHLQGIRLPYYPAVSVPAEDHGALVASAEMHEFGPERNLAKAAAAYRALAGSKDMSVRGVALMRLARVLRQDLKLQDAVAVYSELAALEQTPVAGSPAGLVALRERIALLKATGDDRGATREAALLAAALSEGRFRINHATYEFYKESLPDSEMVTVTPVATRLAAAMEGLWPAFQQQQAGRTTVASVTDAGAFAAVWRRTPQGTAAMVGGLDDVIAPAREIAQKLGVRWALADPAGRRIWGGGLEPDRGIVRTAAETGLPWTMRLTLDGRTSTSAVASSRRRLFAAGFGLVALIMIASGYFVFRSVNKELNVARLQSDFVAGVSHEFRTPLTAMCHLTELLEAGGTASERLPIYYRALGKETRRLHAMVESLLDFGRIDSGRRTYELSETDAAEFVRRTVQEFRDQTGPEAQRVVLLEQHVDEANLRIGILADEDALALALRSLIDNAVKYSPEFSPVTVSLESRKGFVGITVEDKGAGIAKNERRAVFGKFTRGAAARAMNVKGTGIGLTMAAEIVKAHGGRLELVSEPGDGTRFTTLLPAFPSRA